jgi:hypothetical protein
MSSHIEMPQLSTPWNKGWLVGQKAPLRLKEIWGIGIPLQLADKARDLALFNLAIDRMLRGCDLVSLRVCDIAQGKASYLAPGSCNARLIVRRSLRSPSRPGSRSPHV